jgi:branched-subunit amino acid ABC-type transport system permease component
MLISKVQTPNLFQILLLAFGAIAGFGALAAFAFQQMVREPDPEDDTPLVVTSMVHVVSTLGNLLLAYLIIRFIVTNSTPGWLAFPLVGFQATVTYNLLLLLEDFVSERFVEATGFGEDIDDIEEME